MRQAGQQYRYLAVHDNVVFMGHIALEIKRKALTSGIADTAEAIIDISGADKAAYVLIIEQNDLLALLIERELDIDLAEHSNDLDLSSALSPRLDAEDR